MGLAGRARAFCPLGLLYTSGKESALAYLGYRKQHCAFRCIIAGAADGAEDRERDADAPGPAPDRPGPGFRGAMAVGAQVMAYCTGLPIAAAKCRPYGRGGAAEAGQLRGTLRAAQREYGLQVCVWGGRGGGGGSSSLLTCSPRPIPLLPPPPFNPRLIREG